MTVRLAHFSDIHLTTPRLDWKPRDWTSKRLTSWMNLRVFGRGKRFAHADNVVARLLDDVKQRQADHLVFSGDATALGFECEIRRAADALQVEQFPIPGLAVPGNHDYCTHAAEVSGAFERYFAPWQKGRRIDGNCYPFAQQVGDVWLIGVNAATGNRWPWDASGDVGAAQRERLRQLLGTLPTGVRVLVVHYPIGLSSGKRESRRHGMRDLDALLEVARAGRVNLWLHGHRHAPYYLPQPAGSPCPAICAGSATQSRTWSYGEYTIDGRSVSATRRVYDPSSQSFQAGPSFALQLT